MTIIIPTYNRLPALKLCLQYLSVQTESRFQIIVINDGSTDGTSEALPLLQQQSSVPFRWIEQKNSGPAVGRNRAINQATTELCLLLGDDILASPTLVETHCEFHQRFTAENVLALGLTQWDTRHQQITPFMRWYEDVQFDYANLLAGTTPTWRHLYTSNLSFKTSLLQMHPFDERFRAAACEDSELGFRLQREDCLDLRLLPEAMATHVHPTTFIQAAKRLKIVGSAEHLLHEIHPDARYVGPVDLNLRIFRSIGKHPSLLKMLAYIASILKHPGRLHTMVLHGYHQLGYREAAKKDRQESPS